MVPARPWLAVLAVLADVIVELFLRDVRGSSAMLRGRATGKQRDEAQRAGFGHAGCEPAVTSWRTAARGSSAVAIDSPTSTASAPWPA